jgi:uncharacterized protein YecE (DUF72 family)
MEIAPASRQEQPPASPPAALVGAWAGRIKLGTCAWNFEDWRDVFYPAALASNQEIAYYAQYLPAVEVDSTFYAAPRPEVVAAWADKTPEDFTFTVKLPRQITHDARLRGCEGELRAFLASLRPFGPKLGAVLAQFSPAFQLEANEEALRAFVHLLPKGGTWRFAFEFRHASWHQPRIARLLEDHGICWAWSDVSPLAAQGTAAFEFLPRTADFLYLRLMGDQTTKFRPDGTRHFRYGSLLWPRDQGLENWTSRLLKHLVDLQKIFVMINNHYEGFSPLTCQRLGRLLGIPIELPSLVGHAAAAGEGPQERDEQLELL